MFSLWLFPCDTDAAALGADIAHLAAAWGGPRFAAHLTLLSGVRQASALPQPERPFGLDISGWDAEAQPYRAFYLRFAPDPALSAFQARCAAAFPSSRYAFSPHLSLAYGDWPLTEKAKKTGLMEKWRGKRLSFDRIGWMRTEGPCEQWQAWPEAPQ